MASISDTILSFGEPVMQRLRESPEPPSLELIKRALEIVITIWNAHVMASDDWGHPEHLLDLQRIALDPVTTHDTANTLALLTEHRFARFAGDIRVVSKWDLSFDELGRHRFDCTARLPDPSKTGRPPAP
jgi:hypothetical protein